MALSVAISPVASASPFAKDSANNQNQSAKANTDAQTEHLKLLDPYVHPDEKVFNLKDAIAKDRSLEHDAIELASVYHGFGWSITTANEEQLSRVSTRAATRTSTIQPFSNCNGRNGFQPMPPAALLDSCASSALQNSIAAGATVVELAGLLSSYTGISLAVATPIAIGLAAQASLMGVCGSWGNGIRLFSNGMCWSQ
ncbi:hypothetical protein [Corynebacterium epidermidicanis]|nr:hypothetical protein [Corynebacterium epidermidicanis]